MIKRNCTICGKEFYGISGNCVFCKNQPEAENEPKTSFTKKLTEVTVSIALIGIIGYFVVQTVRLFF